LAIFGSQQQDERSLARENELSPDVSRVVCLANVATTLMTIIVDDIIVSS